MKIFFPFFPSISLCVWYMDVPVYLISSHFFENLFSHENEWRDKPKWIIYRSQSWQLTTSRQGSIIQHYNKLKRVGFYTPLYAKCLFYRTFVMKKVRFLQFFRSFILRNVFHYVFGIKKICLIVVHFSDTSSYIFE